MYVIVFTSRAKRALKKYGKSGSFPKERYQSALECLHARNRLPASYDDHALSGELAKYREFHIAYDLLVQYERDDDLRIVTIYRIGTHSELFGS